MSKSMGAASLLLGALLLGGCRDTTPVCYGVEPDGEVETLKPCPRGWTDGVTRNIKEDEYSHLEVKEKKRKTR